MVLTRSFKDHIKAKIESDPEFAKLCSRKLCRP